MNEAEKIVNEILSRSINSRLFRQYVGIWTCTIHISWRIDYRKKGYLHVLPFRGTIEAACTREAMPSSFYCNIFHNEDHFHQVNLDFTPTKLHYYESF
ncbi:hypothetical protein CEXT_532501 [Caerostris extrusa]|uniref:Uncharacterized protein n=1 Tax=Caerostris extrusa TaxID=172846 RepID=A0AAV4T0V5_CAEEX|nr:hypothetical protein CEXT_532501 [Caerostris extrusa]